MSESGSRSPVDARIASEAPAATASELRALWRERPTLGLANLVRDGCLGLPEEFPVFRRCRLAILRSVTVEPLIPLLKTEALLWGLDVTVWVGGYDNIHVELRDVTGPLHRFQPDVVLLWMTPPGIDYGDGSPKTDRVDGLLEDLRASLRAFRASSFAPVLAQDFDLSSRPEGGLLDIRNEERETARTRRLNRGLSALKSETPGFHVVPYDELVGRHGRLRWHDEAKAKAVGLAVRSSMHIHVVREWLKFLAALSGRQTKVLVTDLDDTLWQGVCAEDGPDGVRPHLDVQRKLEELRRQGFLLAISSRNNPEDVAPLLEGHPGMLLRRRDFSATRIDWRDKALHLSEIAAELNVGIESLAFLDESPYERELVRRTLPAVTVIDLPDSSARFREALDQCPTLQRLDLSAEDRARPELYRQDRDRVELRTRVESLEEYLRSLALEVRSHRVDAQTAPRAAQLTQKTNQFNLSGRRYGEPEILARCADPAWIVSLFRVEDRFGDYGHVGLAMARREGSDLVLETFLLSCRALGRSIETAMMAAVVHETGMERIVADYLPTARNAPCAGFLAGAGFRPCPEDASRWWRSTAEPPLTAPDWIELSGAE